MRMKRVDSINVIPFIDIMLVLLVMVLTTATFIRTGLIPVDLPEAKGTAAEHKPSEFKLTIQKDGMRRVRLRWLILNNGLFPEVKR